MVLKFIQLLVALSFLVACGSNPQHAVEPSSVNDSTGSSPDSSTIGQAATMAATATPSPQVVRLVIFDEPE